MKVLITGIGGFVGQHLARHVLDQEDMDLAGTLLFPLPLDHPLHRAGIELHHVDLTNSEDVYNLLREFLPEQIYHLAAQTFVPESFDDPWETLRTNIQSQLNLLHSMVRLDLNARILVVGSSEEYGPILAGENPVDEDQPLRPSSPYSVSKVTQDMLGLQYHLSHDVDVIRVRPFNQIGPGQSKRFVAPAFAFQVAAIEKGESRPILYVGNLQARRDFTDVRDMVRAYRLLLTSGKAGDVYNIGSGQDHSIQELLDILLHMTDAPIEVQFDPARTRPSDVPVIVCDPGKVRTAMSWQPQYTFEQTLADVLSDARTRLGVSVL